MHTGYHHLRALLFLIFSSLSGISAVFAQFNIDAGATNYTQDFNTLTSGTWSNNTTLSGWYVRTDATASVTTYGANTGSTTTAGLYAFGQNGTNPLSDRALGYAASNAYFGSAGSGKGYMGWRLKNNTGTTITALTITYSGEQWRRDNTVAQTLTVEYQTGPSVAALTGGTWTSIPALTFTSPVFGSGAAALDGNTAANRVAGITETITISLAAGEEIMIRWSDLNDANNDHQLAIDDVTVSATTSAPVLSPEIDISGNGVSIANNDLTPSAADHTDFGSTAVAGGTVTRTFTIHNTGTAVLNLGGASPYVSIGGAHAADFSVTAVPSATVAASGSTAFQVTFDPSAAGTRSATLSIASNDADENPYVFAIQGVGSVPATEINLTGNAVSIVNNDFTPSAADHTDFGQALVLSGTVLRTFTIENQGLSPLNLTAASPYVSISGTHAADFSITAIPSTPVAASGSTSFQVSFAPSAPGLRTAILSIASDDADENPYVFAIQGNGVNSAFSDITEDASYPYSSDIDYTQFQAATITNSSTSAGVMRFMIRDGGAAASDADTYGTTLNSIVFSVTNIANLRSAALFDGNAMLANNPVLNTGAGTISFSGLGGSNFTAPDNGSKNLTLRVSFLTAVTDNEQLQFTISSAVADPAGSGFAQTNAGGAVSSTFGNRNRIEVTADRLSFVQQPVTTSENVAMSPAVSVSATDTLGNTDLDYTSAVSITSTGTLSATPVSASAASGLAVFPGLVHTVSGTGFILQATAPALLPASSTTFDIVTVPANSYRTTSGGTWPNSGTATWERFVSGAWTASSAPPANTVNNLYIRHTLSSNAAYAAGAPGTTMIIENGAVFNGGHNCTYALLLVKSGGTFSVNTPSVTVSAGGTLRVESGGSLILNSGTLDNGDGLWNGTEDFQTGSTVELRNWDWDNSSGGANRLISNPSQVSPNSDGYLFGNFYFNASPSENFNFIQSIPYSGTFLPLAKNNLIIRNGSSSSVQLVNTDQDVEIGGDVSIEAGEFRFAAVSAVEVAHTVKGNIEMNGGTIQMNPTSGSSNGCIVNLEGNLLLNAGNINSSDLTATGIRFSGAGNAQYIDVKHTVGMSGIKMEVLNGALVQLQNQDLRLGNNSDLTVRTGGVFSFGFSPSDTPLNITEISASNTTAFTAESGATLKISSDHAGGALRSGTTLSGNVQTDTRSFNPGAHYHFIGKAAQLPGNGVPNPISGMLITEMNNSSLSLTLETSRKISGTLQMLRGDIVTGPFVLELGISDIQTGTLSYTQGHVQGTMKRWFNGTNSGAASGLFPFGVSGNDRFVTVEYVSAPAAGGSLTAHFEPVAMGMSGLPLNIAAAGSCAAFAAENTQTEGYWQIDANDGLNGGAYDITLVGEGLSGISSLCELSALKRVGAGPWQQSGTHQEPQGTIARPVLRRTGATGWSNWGFSGGLPNPLPVVLGEMEVLCMTGGKAVLQWSTYSEVNNAYFGIEEGLTPYAFESVGTVNGAGNSNEHIVYTYELPRSPMRYVRLRQVDHNGDVTVFSPLSINCTAEAADWTYTWNGSSMQLLFGAEAYGTYTVHILDMAGRTLRSEKCSAQAGSIWQSDLQQLKSGIYILNVSNGTQSRAVRFLKP